MISRASRVVSSPSFKQFSVRMMSGESTNKPEEKSSNVLHISSQDVNLGPGAAGSTAVSVAPEDVWTRMTVYDEEAGKVMAGFFEKMEWHFDRTVDGLRQMVFVRRGKKRAFFRKLHERSKLEQVRENRKLQKDALQKLHDEHDYVFLSSLVPTLTPENTPLLTDELRQQLQPHMEMYARGIGLNPSWTLSQKHRFMKALVRFFNEDPNGKNARMAKRDTIYMDRRAQKEMTPADVRSLIQSLD